MASVVVIGAGIAGITASYYLAKKGHNVTIFEKEKYPAMQCSHANGGQISVSNSETWTTWTNVYKGLKWISKKDAPLLIRPNLDWDKAKWLAKFLYHTASNDWARNTANTIRLGIESRHLYHQINQEEQIEYDRLDKGILHVYKTPEYFSHTYMVEELYKANGCEWDIISYPDDLYKIEPTLANFKGLIGGVYTKGDSTGDIHKFCYNLFRVLVNKYNVNYKFDYNVTDIKDLEDFDYIVVANGSDARHLTKQIGDNHPIYPVKGYSITVPLDDLSFFNSPCVSLLDDEAKIVTSRLGSKLRVAGTAELTGDNWDIRKDRIQPLLDWVHTNFPLVNTKDYKSWACLRPMTPNMMPIVTRSKHHPKVYYHIGHGHLGWTLAPATAKKLVDLIH